MNRAMSIPKVRKINGERGLKARKITELEKDPLLPISVRSVGLSRWMEMVFEMRVHNSHR